MSNNLLETPIEYLKGVGPSRGQLLRKELGIHKYGDLVNFFQIDTLTGHVIIKLMNSRIQVLKFRLSEK